MKIKEYESFPVRYDDILVFPEYFMEYSGRFPKYLEKWEKDDIDYYVVGVGKSYDKKHTSVVIFDYALNCFGVRHKISIFMEENSETSTRLEVFKISKNRTLGIVVCREVLHTAIAEVLRMMKVDIVAVTIGFGDFYDLQRASWIDQMCLFSDITRAPLVCASGATKKEGGINLIIER